MFLALGIRRSLSRPGARLCTQKRAINSYANIKPQAFSRRLWRATLLVGSVTLFWGGSVHSNGHILLEAPKTTSPLEEITVVADPATSTEFPRTLSLPSCPPLTLVGLGVRTVSFLRVKVYVVGFYAEPSLVQNVLGGNLDFDSKIDKLIADSTCAIRIVPTRSTGYQHLRDAFMRSLRARMIASRKEGLLNADAEDALEEPLMIFRSTFPTTQLEKGTPLVIYSKPVSDRGQIRSLVLEGLGAVENSWIAETLFKTYFIGSGVSPAVRLHEASTASEHPLNSF